jgi:PAS domain S-box-containing protein
MDLEARATPRGGTLSFQELNRDFLTLLANTSDFIYFKDRDGRIRFCSQAMATLCGYRDWRELIGKHDLEIFPEETARIYYEEELPVFRDGKALLNKVDPYLDPRGNRRWVNTSKWPVFGEDGHTVVGLFGISRDVTDRLSAVAELRREALRNEMLLRSATDGIHVLDPDGNVLQANDVFCQMLGYTQEEALKLNVSQWDARWSAQELKREIIPRILEHREVFETKHRRRNGEVFDVEVSAAGVEIDGQQLLFAASRDITERKRAEAELRRFADELAQANRMKDIFTDVLRHDILNPVNAIMISTELLLKRETDPAKIEVLKRVRQSARNLTEMTDNASKLAALSAGEALEYFPGDPVELLRSVLPDLEHRLAARNMTLVDLSGSGFAASFNPIMKEVCANLIANAIKYGPEGSRVEICVEDQGEVWLLTVKDRGEGVPDEHKQRIFNRFERLAKLGVQGSGLGLTITKQIVMLHGGTIWLENNPGGGSIFFVKIPKRPETGPR